MELNKKTSNSNTACLVFSIFGINYVSWQTDGKRGMQFGVIITI